MQQPPVRRPEKLAIPTTSRPGSRRCVASAQVAIRRLQAPIVQGHGAHTGERRPAATGCRRCSGAAADPASPRPSTVTAPRRPGVSRRAGSAGRAARWAGGPTARCRTWVHAPIRPRRRPVAPACTRGGPDAGSPRRRSAGRRPTQPQPPKGARPRVPGSARPPRRGWQILGQRHGGFARRSGGTVTDPVLWRMIRSRNAARRTARTLFTRARTVPGASPRLVNCLIHCSTWDRRSSARGPGRGHAAGSHVHRQHGGGRPHLPGGPLGVSRSRR